MHRLTTLFCAPLCRFNASLEIILKPFHMCLVPMSVATTLDILLYLACTQCHVYYKLWPYQVYKTILSTSIPRG